jgi:hypothetical protein
MSHRGHQTPSTTFEQHSENTVQQNSWKTSNPISRDSLRVGSRVPAIATKDFASQPHNEEHSPVSPLTDEGDSDSDSDDMEGRRPALHRPTDGRSHQPLLHKEDDEERGRTGYDASPDPPERPTFSRRSTMRSRSPDTQAKLATRKKYTYAAFFLGLSLVSFVIQTETAVYIQHQLGWNKAYCML